MCSRGQGDRIQCIEPLLVISKVRVTARGTTTAFVLLQVVEQSSAKLMLTNCACQHAQPHSASALLAPELRFEHGSASGPVMLASHDAFCISGKRAKLYWNWKMTAGYRVKEAEVDKLQRQRNIALCVRSEEIGAK